MTDDASTGLGSEGSSAVEEMSIAPGFFHQLELFEGLDSHEVREITRACERRTFEAGDVLFEQGDPAESLYMIENGELEVRAVGEQVGEEVVLAVLGSGTVVGEMAILEGTNPRSATVEVLSDTQAFVLSRKSFNKLREARRPVAYKLILNLAHIMGDRRRQTDKRVAEVFDDPATHIDAFESQVHEMLGRLRKA